MCYQITVKIGRRVNERFITNEIDPKRIEELISNGFTVHIKNFNK